MTHGVVATWEYEVVERAAAMLQPSEQAPARRLANLELHRSPGLLLHHDGAIADAAAGNNISDPHLH